jgi:selenocysteine lyase/cysteine desulfurase
MVLEQLPATRLAEAELLNPPAEGPKARFLAFRHSEAERWHAMLQARNCITDVRGEVLRIGFGIYQDEADVQRLVELLRDV